LKPRPLGSIFFLCCPSWGEEMPDSSTSLRVATSGALPMSNPFYLEELFYDRRQGLQAGEANQLSVVVPL
jgi:hypothetical protein